MKSRSELVLPMPPSANKIWRRGRFCTYLSSEAVAYKRIVAKAFINSGFVRIDGRVSIDIVLHPKRPKDWQKREKKLGDAWVDSVRCLDLDNVLKSLLDSLKDIAFEDDKWVHRLIVTKGEPQGDGFVIVQINPAD